jgi:hypothetical protein
LARKLGIEFGQFLILCRQGSRLFEYLLSRLAKFGNLALKRFSLSGEWLELFPVLLLDSIES